MLRFEEYLTDFTNTINILDFVINLLIATILSLIIKAFYIKFGKSFSNREKFAIIFVPMALSTLLIITVVQSSIALSLGLVGALSIVRFRAAIKEPEELTYIFLIIGVGLTCGANKPILAIMAILFILPLVYLNSRFASKDIYSKNKVLINMRSSQLSIEDFTKILSQNVNHVELKRMERDESGLFATFLTKPEGVNQLSNISNQLMGLDEEASINIIDQTEMVV